MSNYTLNSARNVSESEVRAFADKIRKRELALNVAGRTGASASYAYWKSACQRDINSKVERLSYGDYAPTRWHDIQANKAEIFEQSSAKWKDADNVTVMFQQEVLQADLKKQERAILLGETLAGAVRADSEFAVALDELSKAMALADGVSSALDKVQQKFPSEMTTFLLADSRDNKGQFFESLLAASVDWEELVDSSGTYNPFSHITIDARSDVTPAYAVTVSNPEDLTCDATVDEEYAKRKGQRIKALRQVAENVSASASSSSSRSLLSRVRSELLPRQIKFRPRGEATSQSGPADEQAFNTFDDHAEDSTSVDDPFGDHARDSTSFSSDRASSDAASYQGAQGVDDLF
ncbi:hypothetical protein JCM24511_02280 [Saitozyma sp. JCM 24511]|nr:hypothetical protein JCM24511_02280 [Saitozyma sp. JCM 24511]